jgi:hypothetical protein
MGGKIKLCMKLYSQILYVKKLMTGSIRNDISMAFTGYFKT